jgi:hypothetical protein
MPLTKSAGNMYPWVSHTHTHLGGEWRQLQRRWARPAMMRIPPEVDGEEA